MTTSRIKLSTLHSELIRIRRICSHQKYIDLYDSLLLREYETRGYANIKRTMEMAKLQISENYDANLKRKPTEAVSKLVYGATSIFDTVSNSHVIVKNIIKNSLTFTDIRLPFTVPNVKIKRLLHTKKRYLQKTRAVI